MMRALSGLYDRSVRNDIVDEVQGLGRTHADTLADAG